ncbi:S-layer homology domain-containing protein [Pseudanabaena minima]|uniref:S-layer homology domain-containing protein n=1 Tax=Pseudanabaena minima TaxID=890415 RepID=UPI003DA94472
MKFKSRLTAKTCKFLLFGLTTYFLTACQGSNIGSSLENAIAPASPSSSEVIAENPNPPTLIATSPSPSLTAKSETKPATKPINSPTSSDRWSSAMKAISLQSLLKKTTPDKNSLKELFFINFSNSQMQSGEFSDLDTAPASLKNWIKDLNQLGTITPKTGQQFKPNILVARREYARWLLETNNRLYKNQPSRQIRLAQPTDSASFTDIPNNHPDFGIIQGLANAGLIGGSGSFRPNDPLLREELVQWKIPLDLRQPLPSATLESVSQSWGFKDSDRISENALSAIFADAQLRDLSNIRRSFGFTTLLQPQKPVTRAEAAASLWYFGTAMDGTSVSKALETDR